MKIYVATVLAASLLFFSTAFAQPKPAVAPAEAVKDGQWDEIDQRLVFLMVRLANVEASLDAVEKAIGKTTGKRSSNLAAAKRAESGNDLMDRKAGGPMLWSEFYGRTAEKFFYHPTDRNTSYHTVTVLGQQGPQADNKVGGGVPASQGLPVHQRPPQFDYIYRANQNAKEHAEADAAELKGKVDALVERRQRLEIEQAGLWCEVAFRAVSHYDLDKKPLYRFEPLLVNADAEAQQHASTVRSAASFMRLALSIIDEAQKDQAATFSKIKPAISDARQKLNDSFLRLAVDVTDRKSAEGRFAALAKRLDDVASNLSDSYLVANEGDKAKDEQRKDTFRALLQESLVNYSQIILAMDEMATVMKDDWKIKPDVDKPIQFVSLASITSMPSSRPSETSSNASNNRGSSGVSASLTFVSLFDGRSLAGWNGDKQFWSVQNGAITGQMGPGDPITSRNYISTESTFSNFVLTARFKVSSGDAGILFRGKPNRQFALQVLVGNLKPGSSLDESPGERKEKLRWIIDDPGLAKLFKQDQWNDIKITANGDQIECEVNGRHAFSTTYTSGPRSGVISLKVKQNTAVAFRDIKVARLPD